jgi:glutamyl-Q tRNA(Asp) synthetase
VFPGPQAGRAPAVRLRIPRGQSVAFDDAIQGRVAQDVGTEVGDVVLRRADGFWAYQLAVVVDDAAQAITDVVRGADLLDSTPRQILLQRALGLPTPRYAHLPSSSTTKGASSRSRWRACRSTTRNPLPALRAAGVAGPGPRRLRHVRRRARSARCGARGLRPAHIPSDPLHCTTQVSQSRLD